MWWQDRKHTNNSNNENNNVEIWKFNCLFAYVHGYHFAHRILGYFGRITHTRMIDWDWVPAVFLLLFVVPPQAICFVNCCCVGRSALLLATHQHMDNGALAIVAIGGGEGRILLVAIERGGKSGGGGDGDANRQQQPPFTPSTTMQTSLLSAAPVWRCSMPIAVVIGIVVVVDLLPDVPSPLPLHLPFTLAVVVVTSVPPEEDCGELQSDCCPTTMEEEAEAECPPLPSSIIGLFSICCCCCCPSPQSATFLFLLVVVAVFLFFFFSSLLSIFRLLFVISWPPPFPSFRAFFDGLPLPTFFPCRRIVQISVTNATIGTNTTTHSSANIVPSKWINSCQLNVPDVPPTVDRSDSGVYVKRMRELASRPSRS